MSYHVPLHIARAATLMRRIALTAAFVPALAGPLHAQATPPAQHPIDPVSLSNTQLRHLHSQHAGTNYQIRVRLPDSYGTSDRRYPVLYLLDGDLLFGMASDIVRYLEWGRLSPELIIVAPAYGSVHSPDNGGTNMRGRDFSVFSSQSGFVPGGGERFLDFLRAELIPYVEREFRADPNDRTLVGFSRGGDFAVHALFRAPELFQRYVVLDNFYPEYLQLEAAFAQAHHELPKRVFFASRFPRGGLFDLAERLKARGYAGLSVDIAHVHPRHVAVPGEGITRGIVSVFNKRSVLAELLPLVVDSKVEDIVAAYERLRSTAADAYDFGEAELSDLGNALSHMGRVADAITIYRLNLKTHPRSVTTYRRLATAYESIGDKEQAIAAYRALLQINPEDRAAAAALERLAR